jgi:hypothetical protein
MNLNIPTFAAICALVNLTSCLQTSFGGEHVRSSLNYDYTAKEVREIRTKLKNTKFPQEDGFVQALLKKDFGVGMLIWFFRRICVELSDVSRQRE